MPVYFVLRATVNDPEGYAHYQETAGPLPPNARFIARDPEATTLEGEDRESRAAIIEFPSEEDFRAWYDSPRYSRARETRLAASDSTAILVKGVE